MWPLDSPCTVVFLYILQVAPEPEQVLKQPAWTLLEELTPLHVMPIFEWVMESMDLKDMDHILERALNGQQNRREALSTELFPGRA